MASFEIKLVGELAKRLEDMKLRARSDVADGICRGGKDGASVEYNYGFSMGYLRGIRDFGVIIEQIAEELIKGDQQ